MKCAKAFLALAVIGSSSLVSAQYSQVVLFRKGGVSGSQTLAYQPMPVIFLHGIFAGRDTWNLALQHFPSLLGTGYNYAWSTNPVPNTPGQNIQYNTTTDPLDSAYLNTFDYGFYGRTDVESYGHRQTFDDIASNAWWGVAHNSDRSTNQCSTLKDRINAVRDAYVRIDHTRPPVILVGHSMGGIVAHYYLTKAPQSDGAVARLVTLGSPHYGAFLPDLARSIRTDHPGWGRKKVYYAFSEICSNLGITFGSDVSSALAWAYPTTAHPDRTGMENMTSYWPPFLTNPVIAYFTGPGTVPGNVEYIFNSFRWTPPTAVGWVFNAMIIPTTATPDEKAQYIGDGIVSVWSQEGRVFMGLPPSILGTNINPLIFGISMQPYVFAAWQHSHMGEATVLGAIVTSLCAVAYNTPSLAGQNFSKYLPAQDTLGSNTVFHTDEPGINALNLVFNRTGQNPILIPSLNTWTSSGLPSTTKEATNSNDLVGHQIIGDPSGVSYFSLFATCGAKNSVPDVFGSFYDLSAGQYTQQVLAGNEYLPANLIGQWHVDHLPVASSLTINPAYPEQSFDNCLAMLNNTGTPTAQYGYLTWPGWPTPPGNNYVALQGYQTASGLATPQAERAFDVPVDSATVVTILKKINAMEILSNACHAPTPPTRWMNNVQEWVTTDSGAIILNFFPVTTTPNAHDAWINIAFAVNSSNYNATNKTITVNPTNAPSQLIISNRVYLGGNQVFTNSYGGIVPALTANTLAGVPINEAFLTQIRTALNGILHKYQTNTACVACGGYDLPTALHAAGISNDTWSTIVGGLILSSHITELQKVLSVLTTELHCCCSNVIITLSPSSASATDTNALPDGSSNVVYSTTITAGGTDCPHYKFTVASGSSLPPDLILTNLTDTSAAITGTPTTVGSNTFVITATETNGCSTNQLYELLIIPPVVPCVACPSALTTYQISYTIRNYSIDYCGTCDYNCTFETALSSDPYHCNADSAQCGICTTNGGGIPYPSFGGPYGLQGGYIDQSCTYTLSANSSPCNPTPCCWYGGSSCYGGAFLTYDSGANQFSICIASICTPVIVPTGVISGCNPVGSYSNSPCVYGSKVFGVTISALTQ